MAFCPKCGSSVEGRFCPKCGATVDATAATEHSMPVTTVSAPGLTENVASALCYLGGLVTGIIFLVLAPYNKNPRVRFHAFQSIFLNVAWIVFYMALNVLMVAMPVSLYVVVSMLEAVLSLAFFVLWLFLMWKAYQGQTVVLPLVGPIAQQQAAK